MRDNFGAICRKAAVSAAVDKAHLVNKKGENIFVLYTLLRDCRVGASHTDLR